MKILLVDDDQQSLDLIEGMLTPQNYEVLKCGDGKAAVEIAKKEKLDLILLDILMPGMSGYETATLIKSQKTVPIIIMVTALRENEDLLKGLESGADEFISKPFRREELLLRVKNMLKLREYQNELEDMVEKRTKKMHKALELAAEAHKEVISRLLLAAEYRDDATGNHVIRVGKYSRIIAFRMNLGVKFFDEIEIISQMHDIGKIGIPDKILLKPDKLNREEFEIMKTHTLIGARILANGTSTLIDMAYKVALTHHERWDGAGYPNGKKGDAIPIEGRIVALADAFDELTSNRPYRKAFSWERSLEIIENEKGTHFDPQVVDAFLKCLEEIGAIYGKFQDFKIPA